MQVQRNRELDKGNIKWRQCNRVVQLRNNLFQTLERWKTLNQELYSSSRRDVDNENQINLMKNIEEMLSGIVIQGGSIWELIRTDKLQRRLEIEKSFFQSKLEIAKIQNSL